MKCFFPLHCCKVKTISWSLLNTRWRHPSRVWHRVPFSRHLFKLSDVNGSINIIQRVEESIRVRGGLCGVGMWWGGDGNRRIRWCQMNLLSVRIVWNCVLNKSKINYWTLDCNWFRSRTSIYFVSLFLSFTICRHNNWMRVSENYNS